MESTVSSEHNGRVLGVLLGREREGVGRGQHGLHKVGQYYDDKWKPNFWSWVHCSVYNVVHPKCRKCYKLILY